MILPETLKTILVDTGFIKEADFLAAIKAAEDLEQPLADVLVFRGFISEDALGKLIAEHYQVPYIKLGGKIIPYETLSLIPEQAAVSFHAIPFKAEAGQIQVGFEDPTDIEAIEFVKRRTNLNVSPYFITPADFAKTIGQYKRNIKTIFQRHHPGKPLQDQS
jgi:type IV pilus assembly protein PilB